jgi:Protein of unknown function (DUF4240)
MGDERFWALIESAWQTIGGRTEARRELAAGKLSEDGADDLAESLDDFTTALKVQLDELPADELLAFDRILERKLYDIDRADIHEHTDGSDDGFLYARGFIVAAGKDYYEAVDANPAIAMMDIECEEMCYLPWHMYREKIGEIPPSEISRESGSRAPNGWMAHSRGTEPAPPAGSGVGRTIGPGRRTEPPPTTDRTGVPCSSVPRPDRAQANRSAL